MTAFFVQFLSPKFESITLAFTTDRPAFLVRQRVAGLRGQDQQLTIDIPGNRA